MNLTDIYRIFYPTVAEYTFFSEAHETFSKMDHILRYRASPNKHKKINITSCTLCDHNGTELEVNSKEKT
jgi:hypothetical protein